jgi:hypothetical protein
MRAIQTIPITGGEAIEDDGRPLGALIAFYRAFNAGDLEAMRANWADGSDDWEPSMSNPIGGIRRGWKEIAEGYSRLFAGPARVSVAFHDYTLQEHASVAIFVGRERGVCVTPEGRVELSIRTSRTFVQIGGVWRQLHHHGSFEDGALLTAYQQAVLGTAP